MPISYNIAPSQKVLTIRFNPETRVRLLDALQWGLIPYWAKDPKIGYRTINARAESIDKAPSFREAFTKGRCLIPADGFYEWRKTVKPKLPFAIAIKDGRPFTFAGLCENWKDPQTDEWVRTCTIITGEPNELVAQIHPRMPVIIPETHHAAWLGETDDGNLKELLVPYPADQMCMWEISPRVNTPKNDDPSLWEPVHQHATQTTPDALELLRE
ncbi:MAG: SOS response-associated peptidase [Verrucomicrobia bacterium]|nr:SOS response-associated peptidase [Verrucomicrobiota bacterium]MBV9129567.1 SOS response-associated peptidase [Verrucomicrobiota bacterium]